MLYGNGIWIVEVANNDVIIGDHGASLEWEGNLHLRNIVATKVAANSMVGRPFPFYTTVMEIIAAVEQRGARFLREYIHQHDGDLIVRWRQLNESDIHEKMKNACEICLLHMTGHGNMVRQSMDQLRLFDKLPDTILKQTFNQPLETTLRESSSISQSSNEQARAFKQESVQDTMLVQNRVGVEDRRVDLLRLKRKSVDDSSKRDDNFMKRSSQKDYRPLFESKAPRVRQIFESKPQDFRPLFGGNANGHNVTAATPAGQKQRSLSEHGGREINGNYMATVVQQGRPSLPELGAREKNGNDASTTVQQERSDSLPEHGDGGEMVQDDSSVELTAHSDKSDAFPEIGVSASDPMPTARQEEIYQRTLRLLKQKERQHSTLEMALSRQPLHAAEKTTKQDREASTNRTKTLQPSFQKSKKVKTEKTKNQNTPIAAGTNFNNLPPEVAMFVAAAAAANAPPIGGGPPFANNNGQSFYSSMEHALGNNLLEQQQRLLAYLAASSNNNNNNNFAPASPLDFMLMGLPFGQPIIQNTFFCNNYAHSTGLAGVPPGANLLPTNGQRPLIQATTVGDPSASDTSIRDTTFSDTSIRDTSMIDTSIRDTSIQDTSTRDTSIRDTSTRDDHSA